MTAWEDLTELEQLAGIYSDCHKDAYGFRPRNDTSSWTVEDFNNELDRLSLIIRGNEDARRIDEQRAIVQLDQDIAKLIGMGAADRSTALRWIIDDEHDLGYVEYCRGLPYGHLKKLLG